MKEFCRAMTVVLTCTYGAVCAAAVNPVAGALTWTGVESGEWNTTALNWVDENTNAVVWTQGARAAFNESATTTTVTLTENIVAASCFFTSQVYKVTGAYTLSVPSVTVRQRKGRFLNADFCCPLISSTGTLTKDGDGFVTLSAGGTLSNDLHVADGRWTALAADVFKHDITVTVDANAMFNVGAGQTATIGTLAGSGLVYFGLCPIPRFKSYTSDGNCGISCMKTYTHAVSAGVSASPAPMPFSISGVAFTRANQSANVAAADGRGGFKFSGFTWGASTFTDRPASVGIPAVDGLSQLLSSLVLSGNGAGTVDVSDLIPGRWYSFRVYSIKFDNNPRDAYLTFNPDNGGPMTRVLYDAQGDRTSPYYQEYSFCANDAGTFKFSMTTPAERGTSGATWHFYGFTVEEKETPESAALTLSANDGAFTGQVLNGTIAGFPLPLTWMGSTGTWNTTDANWRDANGQPTVWKNGAQAIFTGDAGMVTIDGDIDGSIYFQTNGYTVAGNFGAHAVTVTAAAGTSNTFAAATSGVFTKKGSGLVALDGAAALTGRVEVNEGTLIVCTETCLTSTVDVNVASGAQFQTVASATIGHLRGEGTLVVGTFPQASVNAFTCDEDSGFSTNKTYTHLYDFGNSDTGATINGVKLTAGTATSMAATPANGGYSGIPSSGTKDAKLGFLNADGITEGMGIYDLLRDSRYAVSYTPHLNGLQVGKWHELRLYYARFENINPTGRRGDITFSPFADGTFRDLVIAYQNARPASYVAYKFQPVKDDFAFNVRGTPSDWLLYGLSVELCEAPVSDMTLTVTVRAGTETTFAGPVMVAGKFVKAGAGTLRLTHAGTDFVDLTATAGKVVLPSGAAVSRKLDISSGATVTTSHETFFTSPTAPDTKADITIDALDGAGTFRLEDKADFVSGRFSLVYVTSDATSGFSANKTYTHLMDFGNGGATTVNDVTIPEYATTGPNNSYPAGANVSGCVCGTPYDWATQGGLTRYIANTEGVFNLYRDFVVCGEAEPWTLRLHQLQAGQWHEFRWYQRAPINGDLHNNRHVTYRFDPDSDGPQGATVMMYQNAFAPHYLSYKFYATTENCFTFSILSADPENGAHIYGFSCEVIDDPTEMETGVVSVAGGSFAGSITGTNDWFKTGTNVLTLAGTSPFTGTAVVQEGTLLSQGATLTAGSVQVAEGGAFGVALGATASVGGNFTVAEGGTIRYAVEQGAHSGAVAVTGDTSLAATGTVDVVTTLDVKALPSRSPLVVTDGTTTEPASYHGWKTVLNGGETFSGFLKLDDNTFNLHSIRGTLLFLW